MQTVNEKCRFDEPEVIKTTTEATTTNIQFETKLSALKMIKSQEVEDLKTQKTLTESQIASLQQTNVKNANELELLKAQLGGKPSTSDVEEWKSTIAELKVEKAELKAELVVARSDVKAEKLQCSKQLDFIQNLHNKMESQWNATLISQTKDLRDNLQLKLQEIFDLTSKLQKKETEIIDKIEEIKNLKKKIEVFGQF